MLKKISVLALAGLLAVPALASAGAGGPASSLDAQIAELTKQLEALKAQMKEMKAAQTQQPMAAAGTDEGLREKVEALEERAESWDLASRIQLSGDIRSRLDFHNADTVAYYPATDVGTGVMQFVTVQPVLAGMATDPATDTVAELLGALGGALGSATDLQTALGGNTVVTDSQALALWSMFTNGEVGGMLATMAGAGAPTTVLTDAMATPQALAGFMKQLSPAARASIFSTMGYDPRAATEYENDTLWTTRLRLNMRAKATENVEVKARFVGYKTWGMQDSSMPEMNENGIHDTDSPYFLNSRTFDGTSGRQPVNNLLVLDRAFMNWNNIGGQPIWFSIGRRPTTDGPPAHLRMGADERLATPVAVMDYPFDGISVGYAYNNFLGIDDASGRIRFCYGRGFEAGPNQKDTGINDVDFAGLSWDIYQKGNRFINIQSFAAMNLFNVPGDTRFPNPMELAAVNIAGSNAYQNQATGAWMNSHGTFDDGDDTLIANNTYLDRMNMGNVYHTSGVYLDKYQDLNYFVAAGWSHTEPNGTDEMGISLLSDFWGEEKSRDGYCLYIGGRYDIPNSPFKIGAEYNYGSKYWLGFTPGHDDQYASKLYTRGSVYEVYGIYDIPAGEAISKYGKAFIRLGYQHYDYDYTYSGMWLGTPQKIDDIKNDPLSAQFYRPIDKIDQVYLTLEAFF